MKADTWMPLYVSDYLRKTQHLSTAQHGAYLLLIMAAWTGGGQIPADSGALAAITKMTRAEWKKNAPSLLPFFEHAGDVLVHARVLKEVNRAIGLAEARRSAGKAAHKTRWAGSTTEGMSRSERLAAARERGTHTKEEWLSLVETLGNICVKCRAPQATLMGGVLCKDHIVAVYRGGSDSIDNLQPVCRECNTSKGGDETDYREDASPGWRKTLAKRLANAQQNPAPTRIAPPSPLTPPSEGSEANASAAGGGALDPDGDTWRMMRLLLADRHRMSPAASGKFFGGLLKEHGLEARDMMGAVAEATGNGTQDAKGFLAGAAAHRAKKRAGPQLSPSELAMRSNIQ